jgi:hypothetical protein
MCARVSGVVHIEDSKIYSSHSRHRDHSAMQSSAAMRFAAPRLGWCHHGAVRTIGLGCALLLFGCEHSPTPSSQAPSVASTDAISPQTGSDGDTFRRWTDATVKQLEADARAGATRAFVTQDDLRGFLHTLTPAGFRPRPEYFRSLAAEVDGGSGESFANRMAGYGRSHPDEVSRLDATLEARLKPLLEQIATNAVASIARWKRDPTTALAEAKQRHRSALLVFCADWSGACPEQRRSLTDPSVTKVLEDGFEAAYVDMTDDDSPDAKKRQRAFRVEGLPLLLVYDTTGNEKARHAEFADVPGLLTLLARAQ